MAMDVREVNIKTEPVDDTQSSNKPAVTSTTTSTTATCASNKPAVTSTTTSTTATCASNKPAVTSTTTSTTATCASNKPAVTKTSLLTGSVRGVAGQSLLTSVATPTSEVKCTSATLQILPDGGLRVVSNNPSCNSGFPVKQQTPPAANPQQYFFVKRGTSGQVQLLVAPASQPNRFFLLRPSQGHTFQLGPSKVAGASVFQQSISGGVKNHLAANSGTLYRLTGPPRLPLPLQPKGGASTASHDVRTPDSLTFNTASHDVRTPDSLTFSTEEDADLDSALPVFFAQSSPKKEAKKKKRKKAASGVSLLAEAVKNSTSEATKDNSLPGPSCPETGAPLKDGESDSDESAFPFRIDSVFSLSSDEPAMQSQMDAELKEERQPVVITIKEEVNSLPMPTQEEMLEMCGSSFVVLERLSDKDMDARSHVNVQPRCSDYCRKRTLNYMCVLDLIACRQSKKRRIKLEADEGLRVKEEVEGEDETVGESSDVWKDEQDLTKVKQESEAETVSSSNNSTCDCRPAHNTELVIKPDVMGSRPVHNTELVTKPDVMGSRPVHNTELVTEPDVMGSRPVHNTELVTKPDVMGSTTASPSCQTLRSPKAVSTVATMPSFAVTSSWTTPASGSSVSVIVSSSQVVPRKAWDPPPVVHVTPCQATPAFVTSVPSTWPNTAVTRTSEVTSPHVTVTLPAVTTSVVPGTSPKAPVVLAGVAAAMATAPSATTVPVWTAVPPKVSATVPIVLPSPRLSPATIRSVFSDTDTAKHGTSIPPTPTWPIQASSLLTKPVTEPLEEERSSAECVASSASPPTVTPTNETTSHHDSRTISHHDSRTASQHNSRTTSQHDSRTTSQHNSRTTSQHDSRTTSQHNFRTTSQHDSRTTSQHNSRTTSQHHSRPSLCERKVTRRKLAEVENTPDDHSYTVDSLPRVVGGYTIISPFCDVDLHPGFRSGRKPGDITLPTSLGTAAASSTTTPTVDSQRTPVSSQATLTTQSASSTLRKMVKIVSRSKSNSAGEQSPTIMTSDEAADSNSQPCKEISVVRVSPVSSAAVSCSTFSSDVPHKLVKLPSVSASNAPVITTTRKTCVTPSTSSSLSSTQPQNILLTFVPRSAEQSSGASVVASTLVPMTTPTVTPQSVAVAIPRRPTVDVDKPVLSVNAKSHPPKLITGRKESAALTPQASAPKIEIVNAASVALTSHVTSLLRPTSTPTSGSAAQTIPTLVYMGQMNNVIRGSHNHTPRMAFIMTTLPSTTATKTSSVASQPALHFVSSPAGSHCVLPTVCIVSTGAQLTKSTSAGAQLTKSTAAGAQLTKSTAARASVSTKHQVSLVHSGVLVQDSSVAVSTAKSQQQASVAVSTAKSQQRASGLAPRRLSGPAMMSPSTWPTADWPTGNSKTVLSGVTLASSSTSTSTSTSTSAPTTTSTFTSTFTSTSTSAPTTTFTPTSTSPSTSPPTSTSLPTSTTTPTSTPTTTSTSPTTSTSTSTSTQSKCAQATEKASSSRILSLLSLIRPPFRIPSKHRQSKMAVSPPGDLLSSSSDCTMSSSDSLAVKVTPVKSSVSSRKPVAVVTPVGTSAGKSLRIVMPSDFQAQLRSRTAVSVLKSTPSVSSTLPKNLVSLLSPGVVTSAPRPPVVSTTPSSTTTPVVSTSSTATVTSTSASSSEARKPRMTVSAARAVQPVCERKAVQPVCESETVQPVCERETVQPVCERETVQPVCESETVQPVCERETVQPVCVKKPRESRKRAGCTGREESRLTEDDRQTTGFMKKKQKHALPPGVVIKTEPSCTGYPGDNVTMESSSDWLSSSSFTVSNTNLEDCTVSRTSPANRELDDWVLTTQVWSGAHNPDKGPSPALQPECDVTNRNGGVRPEYDEPPVLTPVYPLNQVNRKRTCSRVRTPEDLTQPSVSDDPPTLYSPDPVPVEPVTSLATPFVSSALQSPLPVASARRSMSSSSASSERIRRLRAMLQQQNEQLEQIRKQRAERGPLVLHH